MTARENAQAAQAAINRIEGWIGNLPQSANPFAEFSLEVEDLRTVIAALRALLDEVTPEPDRAKLRRVLEDSFWPFLANDPHKPEMFWGQAVDRIIEALEVSQ